MESKNNPFKVATDISRVLLNWSAWFLPIVFIIYIVQKTIWVDVDLDAIGGNVDTGVQSFQTFAYQPSKVYMLVIGIFSVSGFLTFYVKQGVTRKTYFYGAALSSIFVSLALMLVAGIVTLIEQLVIPTVEIDSFMGPEASWLLTVAVYCLNILVYYMAGWSIGAGFYRYGGIGGLLFIALAVVFVSISDILWEFELKNPLKILFGFGKLWEFPLYVSFIGTFLLLGIALWIVRATTKRVRIKMK